MILQTRDGKQRFEIYDQNWHFVMGLLSHEMDSTSTLSLAKDNNMLNSVECAMLSNDIKYVISNNKIYEVWDGIKVEPLVNPTAKVIKNLKKNVRPLTIKRKNFLLKLANFVEDKNRLEISFE